MCLQIHLPYIIDWIVDNLLYIDLVITVAILIFVRYASVKQTYWAMDGKVTRAQEWYMKRTVTLVLWFIFMMITLLYHFNN